MAGDNEMMAISPDPALDGETQLPTILAICITFSIASLLTVAMRVYTRFVVLRRPGGDDVVAIVAEIFAILTAVGAAMEGYYGLGRHIWMLNRYQFRMQQTWLFAVLFLYNITINLIKLAFLLQYRRFLTGKWSLRICTWSAAVVIPILSLISIFTLAFSCFPLINLVPSWADRCLPQEPIWYMNGSMTIITDFLVLCIPLPTLFKLNIAHKKQKWMLIAIFALGFFTCIISVIRILQYGSRLKTNDTSWNGVGSAMWCIVEIHCGIICCCLTTLRPLCRLIFPCLRDESTNASVTPAGGMNATFGGSRGIGPGRLGYGTRSKAGGRTGGNGTVLSTTHARGPSFGSDEALRDHYEADAAHAVEMKSWVETGSDTTPTTETPHSDWNDGPDAKNPSTGDKLRVYVKQTFEAKEARLPSEDRSGVQHRKGNGN